MRKVKDMRIVAYFKTVGVECFKIKREESYKDKNREIAVFYFDLTDEDYDRLCTEYYKSIILEYEQNLDCLKTMVYKLTNNKEY